MATTMTLKPVAKQGDKKNDYLLLTLNWLSDASGDSSSSTDAFTYMGKPITNYLQGRELNIGQTSPGSATPTAAYDITVLDDNTQDLFGGKLIDRSATVTESSFAYDTAVYGSRVIDGPLTMVISNAGNAKTGELVLTFE